MELLPARERLGSLSSAGSESGGPWGTFLCLEALAVHDARARLVILVLGDPHLLEGGQGGKDGAANPDRVLPLRRGYDLNLDGRGGKGGDFLVEALVDVGEHRGAAREDSVGVEVTTDVNVALLDRVVGQLVDTGGLLADERGLEQGLAAPEPLSANGDHLAVRQLVALLNVLGALRGGELRVKVLRAVGQLLFDVPDDLALGRGGEAVAALREDLHHVIREVPPGEVEAEDGVGERVPLVDGDGVADSITGVHDNTSGSA